MGVERWEGRGGEGRGERGNRGRRLSKILNNLLDDCTDFEKNSEFDRVSRRSLKKTSI